MGVALFLGDTQAGVRHIMANLFSKRTILWLLVQFDILNRCLLWTWPLGIVAWYVTIH